MRGLLTGVARSRPRTILLGAAVVAHIAAITYLHFSLRDVVLLGEPGDGLFNLTSLIPYWFNYLVATLTLSCLTWLICFRASSSQAWTVHIVAFVLVFAAVARLACVFNSSPTLSNDFYRYVLDGEILSVGANPYEHAPADYGAIGGDINHPELVSVYQPTSQIVFGVAALIARVIPEDPSRSFVTQYMCLRYAMVAFDLLAVSFLLVVLRLLHRSPWWAALYAWHPLTISEVAASGHQDVIGIALLLASLACVHLLIASRAAQTVYSPDRRTATTVNLSPRLRTFAALLAGVTFAGAVGVKPVVIPIAALYVYYLRHDRRSIMLGLAASVLIGLALYLPFVLMPGGITRMLETAITFTRDWDFNSPIHNPIASAFASEWFASLVGDSIARPLSSKWVTNAIIWSALLGIMIVVVRRGADLWQAAQWFLFFALLLSSTVYPWYLLWALALTPIRFNPAVWVWSLTITFSYAVWGVIEPWRVPWPVMVVEYAPVFAVLGWMGWMGCRSWGRAIPT